MADVEFCRELVLRAKRKWYDVHELHEVEAIEVADYHGVVVDKESEKKWAKDIRKSISIL